MELTCNIFEYVCKNCQKAYQAPTYIGGYGAFLLRSYGSSSMVFLNAIGDQVFKEVGSIVDGNKRVSTLSESQKADIFQKVVGYAYDTDEFGSHFGIGLNPECIYCGSHAVDSYREVFPPERIVIDVPEVSAVRWKSLSQNEKEHLVDEKIKSLL